MKYTLYIECLICIYFTFFMYYCADFGWDRVNFLHSSCYGTMFWILAENSVDNIEMFSLLLSSTYTNSGPVLFLTSPHQRVG